MKAQKDLKQLPPHYKPKKVQKLNEALTKQIVVNRKREKETYSKMFFPSEKAVDSLNKESSQEHQEQGGQLSVQDHVE